MPPPQKKPVPNAGKSGASKSRSKKNAQPTQRPPMQRVKILGADMKVRWEWREWG